MGVMIVVPLYGCSDVCERFSLSLHGYFMNTLESISLSILPPMYTCILININYLSGGHSTDDTCLHAVLHHVCFVEIISSHRSYLIYQV